MWPLSWLHEHGWFLGVNSSYARGMGVGLIVGAVSASWSQGMGTISIILGVCLIAIGAWIFAEQQMKEKLKELDAEAVKPV